MAQCPLFHKFCQDNMIFFLIKTFYEKRYDVVLSCTSSLAIVKILPQATSFVLSLLTRNKFISSRIVIFLWLYLE